MRGLLWQEIISLTAQHIWLVAISMLIATGIGVSTGILMTQRAELRRWALAFAT